VYDKARDRAKVTIKSLIKSGILAYTLSDYIKNIDFK